MIQMCICSRRLPALQQCRPDSNLSAFRSLACTDKLHVIVGCKQACRSLWRSKAGKIRRKAIRSRGFRNDCRNPERIYTAESFSMTSRSLSHSLPLVQRSKLTYPVWNAFRSPWRCNFDIAQQEGHPRLSDSDRPKSCNMAFGDLYLLAAIHLMMFHIVSAAASGSSVPEAASRGE